MKWCWLEDKEQRPPFEEIHRIMSAQLDTNLNAYGYLQVAATSEKANDYRDLR